MQQRVLILSCSARKRPDAELLSALDRYDGPAFRVLRRYLRDQPSTPPEVYILSAGFGLISGHHPIPDYDRQMTRTRAHELQGAIHESLGTILRGFSSETPAAKNLLVIAGQTYREALSNYKGPAAEELTARCVRAGLGRRLSILHKWLREA